MTIVNEIISSAPFDRPDRVILRDESKLFAPVPQHVMPMLNAEFPPIAVYSWPTKYEHMPYSRPRGVFEGDAMRLEYQLLDGRQPFYHRNTEVDEISYQIAGQRTLMTECGTLDIAPGQFSMVPVGVAHDNGAREDIHLIFYIHGPTVSCIAPVGLGELKTCPFPGWQAATVPEMVSFGMGGPLTDVAYHMTDEAELLRTVERSPDKIELLEPRGDAGQTEWIYKAPRTWIGHTLLQPTSDRTYMRRLAADEIQYQAEGRRALITQRGAVTLEPGDFVCIPLGCAYASVAQGGASKHLTVLTVDPVPPVPEAARHADTDVWGFLQKLDSELQA